MAAERADLGALRTTFRAERTRLIESFRARPDVRSLNRGLARVTDRLVLALWHDSGLHETLCLAAVGGFGRRELQPHSDVDLLLLAPERLADDVAARIERFVGACWDVGIDLGHSVRTVSQCETEAAADITVQTSLLERRFLAGRRTLYRELSARLQQAMDPRAFFRGKLFELRQRHAKFEDTPYSLEPNVKESPGGLRDLQSILWIARAADLGSSWPLLARRGLVTRAEAALLGRYERHLRLQRAWLHVISGRREDRLVFDLQAQVARAQGFDAHDARLASEQLMQRYYWSAKAVTQLTTILLQNIEGELFPETDSQPEPIDAEFCNDRGLLQVVDEQLFERDPGSILRAFLTMEQHSGELTGMTARTLRAIWRARTGIDAAFRRDPAHRALFLAILQAPRGVTHELRRMNQWSVLGRYLPAFRRIVGRMQHDLFHVYTVDQHILMVVRNLRRFTMAEHAHEYPFCSQLMAAFDRPWLLYVAALFHDIAKGRGGDHSKLGRSDAARFCRAHGLSDEDRDLVCFLVEHHLTMSSVAQKQDLSDPEVVTAFARLARTERRLTALYLLTVADIRGTSPKVWNAWKGKLLEELFRGAKRVLGGETASADARVDARRAEAVRILNLYGCSRRPTRPSGRSWTSATSCATTRRTSPGRRACCGASRTAPSPWSAPASRRSAKASRWSCTCPTSRTCLRGSAATSTARTCRSWTRASTRRATAGRWTASWSSTRPTPASTATSCRWSRPSSPGGWPAARRWTPRCAAARRADRATSRSIPRSTCAPTSAARTTCCRSSQTTAPACSTGSPARWPATA